MAQAAAEAQWYKDAVIYEVHVRAFFDSDGDGIGDVRGLTAKLDYLQDLGVTAIWLLPFFPSPLRDDGYDIAHYTAVHPDYGTLADVKQLLRAAHQRGLKVIIELVLNHTSDQHPWFQRARQAKPGSPWRNFYVWSDTPEKYQDARIIFQDFESSNWSWDPVAGAYFWHRFYSHQPDLNYKNPQVRQAIRKVVDFWLRLGVDGLRLDAVPYLFEREGTISENLPQTHVALRQLRRHVDKHYPNRMLLAEANQWPEDAVAYFGDNDECHMAFHFPLMPRLFMAVRMEDRFPIIDIMEQTPAIPADAQWALFLRNHDELTLEMVTEEERHYMYRSYAQSSAARINLGIRRRLAPLLGNDRRKIELLNGLLCSLPGTPVIYYGDELGMGDNVFLGDRNGVRTPMQWGAERNGGFSEANPQQLYLPLISDHEYHYEMLNVEVQNANPHSLLHWMRRLLQVRTQMQVFGRGDLLFLQPANRKVLAFVRSYQETNVLVVANLSRFLQYVELDLAQFEDCTPVEMFGRTAFPPVGRLPYMLTLAPYAFYWFVLQEKATEAPHDPELPTIVLIEPWEELLHDDQRLALEAALPRYLQGAVWFNGKTRPILETHIIERIVIPHGKTAFYITVVRVTYTDEEPRLYVVPLALATGEEAVQLRKTRPEACVALLEMGKNRVAGLLYDAIWSPAFAARLLNGIAARTRFRGDHGALLVQPGAAYRETRGARNLAQLASTIQAEHNNTSVAYGERLILKLFRCVDHGPNPEIEVGDYLTERGFRNTPPVVAALAYQPKRGEALHLATLQGFVANGGEAWEWVGGELRSFFEHTAQQRAPGERSATTAALLELVEQAPPQQIQQAMAAVLPKLELLGQRTADMHRVLANAHGNAAFAPEPFTPFYQRSLYQSMRGLLGRVMFLLQRDRHKLPAWLRDDAQAIIELHPLLLERFRRLVDQRVSAMRIRIHGDYHLEQVLVTANDLVIFDFEGEAQRPIIERRLKHSPLRDVATMLRSLHYATYAARLGPEPGQAAWGTLLEHQPWAETWYRWAAAAFLRGYLHSDMPAGLLPGVQSELLLLLDRFLLEKAIYELRYELDNRPHWLPIALHGVQQQLENRE
jgi:maltose alpha-D-glucosyltransferase / alpha-amylase